MPLKSCQNCVMRARYVLLVELFTEWVVCAVCSAVTVDRGVVSYCVIGVECVMFCDMCKVLSTNQNLAFAESNSQPRCVYLLLKLFARDRCN